ncbi:glycosyltransferase family 2 protein [Natronosalvus caseinilyticus]|uniref:glycosyltransferase family 2 protein n=1 Tax=Natronosalvus caseinilyticus TaxID=2953747 RepID=UPI0028B16DBC|nr:glycosyltransferase family 2 protein [Natronosalvus caseinilyticus]
MATEPAPSEIRTASGEESDPKIGEASESLIVPADSTERPRLSVILPTLNEEAGVGECIDRIEAAIDTLSVRTEIIVSDSSTDRTPEIAREKGAIVVHPDESGYGYAYRYGFQYARGEYIAIGDADTTYDFEELPKLFELVSNGDADMVMGSRLKGEIRPGAMPALHQYVGNPLLTRFLNLFYDAGVSDAHSGFRVLSRDALDQLELTTNGMEFASEMIMEAGARGLEIREVPITYHERKGEETLESFRDGWRHVRFMLKNAPGYLFTVPGLVFGMVGVLLMGLVTFGITIAGIVPGIRSMIAGGLLVLVGYQGVSFGVFSTVATDPIRRPTDPVTTWLCDHITLERGATAGLVVFTAGTVYATYLLITWIANGYDVLPLVAGDIATFVAIAIGIQTVFTSFFIDILTDGSQTPDRSRVPTLDQLELSGQTSAVNEETERSMEGTD